MLQAGHLELFCLDTRRTRDFYCHILGFEEEVQQGDSLYWLKNNSLSLLLRPGVDGQWGDSYQTTNMALVLYTDNLESCKHHLEEKGVCFRGRDGSEKCLTFTDPDGRWLQLVHPNDH